MSNNNDEYTNFTVSKDVMFNMLMHAATKEEVREVKQEISNVDSKLSAKIDKLDAKIDSVDSKLSARIDSVDSKLSAKIDSNFKWLMGMQILTIFTIVGLFVKF
ncbi:hypothetical protein [Cysteiniphilum halobium]|uniref:hypothetical protein n=1 Tax=Cysteiniphilum halobium TaxID=2219059 RepID=UPI003F852669